MTLQHNVIIIKVYDMVGSLNILSLLPRNPIYFHQFAVADSFLWTNTLLNQLKKIYVRFDLSYFKLLKDQSQFPKLSCTP